MTKGENRNNSYDTDIAAMKTIKRVWDKWKRSGYRDNSHYYFVFSLPEGGYIITEHKPLHESTTPNKL